MSGLPDLRYSFHDAELADVTTGPRREATLTIDLYSVSYPSRPRVRVRFGGIENFEAVRQFTESIPTRPAPDAYLARIDTLEYDDATVSTARSLHFRLALDPGGSIRIDCAKLSVESTS